MRAVGPFHMAVLTSAREWSAEEQGLRAGVEIKMATIDGTPETTTSLPARKATT
jgi:hypothetical protein